MKKREKYAEGKWEGTFTMKTLETLQHDKNDPETGAAMPTSNKPATKNATLTRDHSEEIPVHSSPTKASK